MKVGRKSVPGGWRGVKQVISANADGLQRNAASRPVDHIALHTITGLDVAFIYEATLYLPIMIALCYIDRQLSVFSTYVHGEAQTALVRFVVDILYKQIATNPQQIQAVEFES